MNQASIPVLLTGIMMLAFVAAFCYRFRKELQQAVDHVREDFLKYFLILIVLLSASFLILANDQLQTGSAIKTLDRSSLQKSTETTDTGTLKVETNPIGASVIINNMRKGLIIKK